MATSKCVGCGATFFEMKRAEPRGSAVVMYFVQCASCGGVVGTYPLYDTGSLIGELAKALGKPLKV